jgi:CheY-like chemotaxis protein
VRPDLLLVAQADRADGGLGVIRAVRAEDRALPILALVHDRRGLARRARLAGASAVLRTPASNLALMITIARLVRLGVFAEPDPRS